MYGIYYLLLVLLWSPMIIVSSEEYDNAVIQHVSFIHNWLEAKCSDLEKKSTPAERFFGINNCLLKSTMDSDIIKKLEKESIVFNQTIEEFTDYFIEKGFNWNALSSTAKTSDKEISQNKCVSPLLQNYIMGRCLQNNSSSLIIPYTADRQKASIKCISPELAVLFSKVSFYEKHSSFWDIRRPYNAKKLSIFGLENLNVIYKNQKIYDDSCENKVMGDNVPYGVPGELNNYIDTFFDGSFVVTYPWGGIEYHKDNIIYYCVVPYSISAVSCSKDNKKVALGSYDGTVIVIDMEQLTDSNYETKNFNDFIKSYPEKAINHKPTVIMVDKYSDTPIIYIRGDDKYFVCATSTEICSGSIEDDSFKNIYSAEAITAVAQYKNILACIENAGECIVILSEQDNEKMRHILDSKESPFKSMCMYENQNGHRYLLTGQENGLLAIWHLPIDMSNKDIIQVAEIQYEYPICSVEVSPNNNYIIVKTTQKNDEIGSEPHYIDHVHVLSTFDHLQDKVKKDNTQLRRLNKYYRMHQNNARFLYTILENNIDYLRTKNRSKVKQLESKIKGRILQLVDAQKITSLEMLKNVLVLFPESVRIGNCWIDGMGGCELLKNQNLLADFNNEIIKKQRQLFITTLQQYFIYKKYTQNELERFASRFYLTIDWKKLELQKDNLEEVITPGRILITC